MKKMFCGIIGEILTIVFLSVFLILTTTLLAGVFDEFRPPADGESSSIRITAKHNGVPALITSFVITVYLYRLALAVHRKSESQNNGKAMENQRSELKEE